MFSSSSKSINEQNHSRSFLSIGSFSSSKLSQVTSYPQQSSIIYPYNQDLIKIPRHQEQFIYSEKHSQASSSKSKKLRANKNDNVSINTYLAPRFLRIKDFHIVIEDKSNNEYQVYLESYQLKAWEKAFKQIAVHFLADQYNKNKIAGFLTIDEVMFQVNTQQFVIQQNKLDEPNIFRFQFSNQYQSEKSHNYGKDSVKIVRKNLNISHLQQYRKYLIQRYQLSNDYIQPSQNNKWIQYISDKSSAIKIRIIGLKFLYRVLSRLLKELKTYEKQMSKRPQVIIARQYENITRMRNEILKKISGKEIQTNSSKSTQFLLLDKINSRIEEGEKQLNYFNNTIITLDTISNKQQVDEQQLVKYHDLIMECMIICGKTLQNDMPTATISSNYIDFLLTLDEVIFVINELPLFLNSDQLTKLIEEIFPYTHQTTLIMKKIVVEIYEKEKKQLQDRKKVEKQVKNIFETILLQNYIMLCYEFKHKTTFPLKPSRTSSLITRKTQFFWSNNHHPILLKRLYQDSTLNFQQLSKLTTNYFDFTKIYKYYADYNWIGEKVRYLVHLSQFTLEILFEFGQSSSQMLLSLFNTSRYLICYFTTHLWIQIVLKILQQIKNQNGDFYYIVFFQALQQSTRWRVSKRKIEDIFKFTYSKLVSYSQNSKPLQQNKKPKINPEKFQLLMKKNPNMKSIYNRLQKKSTEKITSRLTQDEYDFQIVKQIYTSIVQLFISQCANLTILKKFFDKKVLDIKQIQLKEVKLNNLHKKNYNQYLTFITNHKKQLTMQKLINNNPQIPKINEINKLQNQQQYQFIFQRFSTYFIQILKLLSMLLTFPYYSFHTQIENLKQKHFRDKFKPSDSLFCQLDSLYIYNSTRINTQYIEKIIYKLNGEKFFTQYTADTIFMMRFLIENKFNKKVEKLCDVPELLPQNSMFKHPQYIHADRLCIFSLQQCEEFFLKLFDQQQKLINKSAIKQFKQLHEFSIKFKERAGIVLNNFAKESSGISSKKHAQESSSFRLQHSRMEHSEIRK